MPEAARRPMCLKSRDPGGEKRKLQEGQRGRQRPDHARLTSHSTDLKLILRVMEKPVEIKRRRVT